MTFACSGSGQAETLLKIVDVRSAGLEGGVLEDFLVQRHVGLDAFDDNFTQRIAHACKRRFPRFAMSNQFANSRLECPARLADATA